MIEAQEILIDLKTSDFPNLKKEDRRKYHRMLSRMANPRVQDDTAEALDSGELAQRIAAALNGK